MKNAFDTTAERLRDIMAGFTIGQRTMVVLAMVGIIIASLFTTGLLTKPAMTPLFSNVGGSDAAAIVEELNAAGVSYELTNGGTTIMVPTGDVYNMRIALAGKGLPSGAGTTGEGYSLLDSQGITATDFQQNVAYRRALEGELNKTLQSINGVNSAVVRLALPKKDVFSEEGERPTAAVLLNLAGGRTLTDKQVAAITHLVAGSVEGLDAADVTITDADGNELTKSAAGVAGSAAASNEADAQTAAYEARLGSEVQKMLDKVLGPGKSHVRVNAELDYSNRDVTSENYVAPNGIPPLSESNVQERMIGGNGTVGGTLGQTFPDLENLATTGDGSAYGRDQTTLNNAVGKIVERTTGGGAQIGRLSVAVVLDDEAAANVDPVQVQQLVANAVGLNPQRGDSVQVDKLPFDKTAAEAAAAAAEEAEAAAAMSTYLDLGKQVALGLLVLIIAFLLLRRSKRDPDIEALVNDLPEGTVAGSLLSNKELAEQRLAELESGEMTALSQEMAALEAEDKHASLRDQVSGVVDNAPDEVAALLHSWLSETSSS